MNGQPVHIAPNPELKPIGSKSGFRLFDEPPEYFTAMLNDIRHAEQYIYLEIYKFYGDEIGDQFRDALVKRAKAGVEVKLLIDSWGAAVSYSYFADLIKYGGEVRFFTKIKFFVDFFTKNHRRNHRKIVIIDDKITYIGSGNIAGYSLTWREMMLRMEGPLALSFKKVFQLDFSLYNRYIFEKASYVRLIRHGDFDIVRDVPSIARKRISKKFISLIKLARKQVIIETPYFLPGFLLRKALVDAAARGVEIKVIIPRHSDIMLVDILRNKYLGPLHLSNIQILYFQPTNLHAKAMLIDGENFALGSPNFDYRSFRYMHEIVLVGKEPSVVEQLNDHMMETMEQSVPFSYEKWLNRPRFQRFVEWLLLPVRHLL